MVESDSDEARSSNGPRTGFQQRSALVFLTQKATNLSILLDQQELSENVISEAVQKETGLGEILDFTLVERHDLFYLVCLAKSGKLVILDCRGLL